MPLTLQRTWNCPHVKGAASNTHNGMQCLCLVKEGKYVTLSTTLSKQKKSYSFFQSSSSDPKKIALCLVLLQTAQSVELMKATDESLKPSS